MHTASASPGRPMELEQNCLSLRSLWAWFPNVMAGALALDGDQRGMGAAIRGSLVQAPSAECQPRLLPEYSTGAGVGRTVPPPPPRSGSCLHAAGHLALFGARLGSVNR